MIDENKNPSGMADDATLTACIYLGKMTREEFSNE